MHKKTSQIGRFLGGFERIRTAVEGFADLCLATRPRNHRFGDTKLGHFC